MDQATLVRDQYDGGIRFLTRIRERGFDVAAACWAKTPHDAQWYLYVVAPSITGKDHRPGYRAIRDTLQALDGDGAWAHPFERIDPSAVKLIGTEDWLAKGMLELYHLLPGPYPTQYRDSSIGSAFVEGAWVYPSTLFAAPQPIV